ncbi:MAG: halocarboxylic acid dehydrogenase DehI family protein [Alphaproteobacteria bacterium]
MTELPRLRPDPLPAIHPLPEYLAEGRVKQRYEDMKAVFQVPWMGVVTMAFAHYPTFYDTFWEALRPLFASQAFVDAFRNLRADTEAAVKALAPPPIAPRLTELGYAPHELDDIRAMIEVFSHGNFPYLLVATIARLLLEGGEMGEGRAAPAFEGRHAPDVGVPFVLMEAHHVDPPSRALYDDIKTILGLPFVNTDYRALARWPSYFHRAWVDLKTVVSGDEYENIVRGVHDRSLAAAQSLPNPSGLTSAVLAQAAEADASRDQVLEMCRLFQWLLPGLVVNVAYFRQQLQGD